MHAKDINVRFPHVNENNWVNLRTMTTPRTDYPGVAEAPGEDRISLLVVRPQKIFQTGTENPGQIGRRSFVRVKAAEIDHLAMIALEGRDRKAIRRNQDGFGRRAPSVDFLEPVMAL